MPTRDAWILLAGRAVRTFCFGALSVVLALHLAARGFSTAQIGLLLGATLFEDAVFSAAVALVADRLGRRRVLSLTSLLLTLAGAALALVQRRDVLTLAAILGMLSPNGQDAGPFSPLEQALLPQTVPPGVRTRAFAWYNVFGLLPAAFGALAAGGWLRAGPALGLSEADAYLALLWAYAALGFVLCALYQALSPAVEGVPPPARSVTPRASRLGLHRSRRIVLELASLQALDSFAGGFVVQALLAYWLHLRYGVGPEVIGPLFFGTSLLSGLSFLAAARIAERIGLLPTMVFTHLPSNLLLMLVPLMPSLPLAALVLFARHLLSQMDVPTRQAYAMALVSADERSAAAGLTTSARALAQAAAPALSGFAMAGAGLAWPFFVAGGLKSAYDLALYFRFRHVSLPG